MIPDDSALDATSISPGGTSVASLAIVEEALAILTPKLFGINFLLNMMRWPQCLATSRIPPMLWDLSEDD